jgi:hypothetical protein
MAATVSSGSGFYGTIVVGTETNDIGVIRIDGDGPASQADTVRLNQTFRARVLLCGGAEAGSLRVAPCPEVGGLEQSLAAPFCVPRAEPNGSGLGLVQWPSAEIELRGRSRLTSAPNLTA